MIHPLLMSLTIMMEDSNAIWVSGMNTEETRIPEMIWIDKIIPRRNPMFHKELIEDGDGRSIKDLFMIFVIGLFFNSVNFILIV
jgi:hypothetical protein